MTHYLLELALWILLAFFIGCILGYLFRGWFGKDEVQTLQSSAMVSAPEPKANTPVPSPPLVARSTASVESPPPETNREEPRTVAPPVYAPAPVEPSPPPPPPTRIAAAPMAPRVATPAKSEAMAAVSPGKMERPRGISAPRGGKADPLQRISGVGPKNEKVLHALGFFHFDQIAAWTVEQVTWVDDHLKFNGRIKREEWIKQAKLLAEGNDDEFNKLYGTARSKTETK